MVDPKPPQPKARRYRIKVTGGTFIDRTRLRWASLKLLWNTRHLTDEEFGRVADFIVDSAPGDGMRAWRIR